MPDKKPSIEPKVSEVGEESGKKPGWAFIENGEEVVALSRPEMERIAKEEEAKAKAAEAEPEPETIEVEEETKGKEAEPEPEVVEFDNEADFLKAHGLFSKMTQTMAHVDREIDYRLQNISNLGGYDEYQSLFLPSDDPEDKVEILKECRKVENQLRRDQQALERAQELRGEPEKKTEPQKPQRPLERLSEEEREALNDPTSEGYIAALDKYLDYRDAARLGSLQKRLDRMEFEGASRAKELTSAEASALVKEKPYLRYLLADRHISMDDKVDLIATMRDGVSVSSKEDELREQGRTSERRLQTKRKAQLRLTPGKTTRRIPQPQGKIEEQFVQQLQEGREARKADRRAKVAPKLKKLLEQSRS